MSRTKTEAPQAPKLSRDDAEALFALLSDNAGDLRGQVKKAGKFGSRVGVAILESLAALVAGAQGDGPAATKVAELRDRTRAHLEGLEQAARDAKSDEDRAAIAAAAARYAATQASVASMQACRAISPNPVAARNTIRARVLAAVGGL